MGDILKNLPTDNSEVPQEQQVMIDSIFGQEESINNMLYQMRDTFVVGGLYALFTTEFVDQILYKFIPNNYTYLVVTKVVLIMILFFLFQNYSLLFK